MATESASLIPIITTVIASILGSGVVAAIITFILNKPRSKAEIEKIRAETDKCHVETDKLRTEMAGRLSDAEHRLDWTEDAVRKIVAYTPGHFAHQTLCQIRDKADEYYKDSNWHKKRILLLLLDNGYLQPPPGASDLLLTEDQEKLNKRLFEIAALTPMAELMLRLRDEVSRLPTNR